MSDFVDQFISDCLDNGITKVSDICQKAIERKEEIDVELEKIYSLREEKDNLQKVLKSLNHDDAKRGRKSKPPMVNSDIKDAEKNPSYKPLLFDICSVIESSSRKLTSREVIVKVGYDGADPTPVYMGIKFLFEKGILEKDNDRNIGKGPDWDSRENYSMDI